ncbi:MAG TPA: hypothetical protein VJK54_06200 [Chthoniobacterales bacterium]|nr:hypothetical protein [Chthoniobacterales bacterium]
MASFFLCLFVVIFSASTLFAQNLSDKESLVVESCETEELSSGDTFDIQDDQDDDNDEVVAVNQGIDYYLLTQASSSEDKEACIFHLLFPSSHFGSAPQLMMNPSSIEESTKILKKVLGISGRKTFVEVASSGQQNSALESVIRTTHQNSFFVEHGAGCKPNEEKIQDQVERLKKTREYQADQANKVLSEIAPDDAILEERSSEEVKADIAFEENEEILSAAKAALYEEAALEEGVTDDKLARKEARFFSRIKSKIKDETILSRRFAKEMRDGYLFPSRGARIYNGRRYTEHALERMAPETTKIMSMLQCRAIKRVEREKVDCNAAAFNEWWNKHGPQARGIFPSEVEAEITHPGATDVKVITSKKKRVITVYRKENQPATEQFMSDFNEESTSEITKWELPPLYYDGIELADKSLRSAIHDAQKRKIDRMVKMTQAVREVERHADRSSKVADCDLVNNWIMHAQVARKKARQAALAANSMHVFKIALEEINKEEKQGKIVQVTRARRSMQIANHGSDTPEVSTKILISPSLGSKRKIVALRTNRFDKYSNGSLFKRWITPYAKEELRKYNETGISLLGNERKLYLEKILSSIDDEETLPTGPSAKNQKPKKTVKGKKKKGKNKSVQAAQEKNAKKGSDSKNKKDQKPAPSSRKKGKKSPN